MTEEFVPAQDRDPVGPTMSGRDAEPGRDFVQSHRDTEIALARQALNARPFSDFDLDDDGAITREERLGFPYIDDIAFARIDRDGSGSIEPSEFESFRNPPGVPDRGEGASEATGKTSEESGNAWRHRRSR